MKPQITIDSISLKVVDLDRSIQFYQGVLGFQVIDREDCKATLGINKTPFLYIHQPDGIKPKEARRSGLYHFAILLPNRVELGSFLHHMIKSGYPLQGASDHLVSEAIYFADPDGNGIEVYADRPSDTWKWINGEVKMATIPLDVKNLLSVSEGKAWNAMPIGTTIGHIHLHVSELKESEKFYTEGLDFDVVTRYGGQALFISYDQYHHHIGLNTWNGVGAPAASENSVGMIHYTIKFRDAEKLSKIIEQLKLLGALVIQEREHWKTIDPSGNQIVLSV
ncbi:VOC family protein [Peribacillus alkalitolerans]|uniref:VOC family protein n=1 Tax=Peribacillus alkalitolerans TaxID=1550385 RepID=UPI0013D47582|nr:VOC family protein [Peribacillus alkalitolerans]